MNVAIAVPDGGPLFDGHFPGRPILPGIAELIFITRVLAPAGGKAGVRAIRHVRFRGLVRPGDALELSVLSRAADGSVRFDLRRGDTSVANGEIVFGPPATTENEPMAVDPRSMPVTPALEELVPHRPPMRFVEKILRAADDGATCLARVPRACALVEDGETPAFVALEAAAQTAAVWEALRRSRGRNGASSRIGYLVSTRDAILYRSTIPADADLLASVRLEAWVAPLAVYAVQVQVSSAIVLRGTIGTYLSD